MRWPDLRSYGFQLQMEIRETPGFGEERFIGAVGDWQEHPDVPSKLRGLGFEVVDGVHEIAAAGLRVKDLRIAFPRCQIVEMPTEAVILPFRNRHAHASELPTGLTSEPERSPGYQKLEGVWAEALNQEGRTIDGMFALWKALVPAQYEFASSRWALSNEPMFGAPTDTTFSGVLAFIKGVGQRALVDGTALETPVVKDGSSAARLSTKAEQIRSVQHEHQIRYEGFRIFVAELGAACHDDELASLSDRIAAKDLELRKAYAEVATEIEQSALALEKARLADEQEKELACFTHYDQSKHLKKPHAAKYKEWFTITTGGAASWCCAGHFLDLGGNGKSSEPHIGGYQSRINAERSKAIRSLPFSIENDPADEVLLPRLLWEAGTAGTVVVLTGRDRVERLDARFVHYFVSKYGTGTQFRSPLNRTGVGEIKVVVEDAVVGVVMPVHVDGFFDNVVAVDRMVARLRRDASEAADKSGYDLLLKFCGGVAATEVTGYFGGQPAKFRINAVHPGPVANQWFVMAEASGPGLEGNGRRAFSGVLVEGTLDNADRMADFAARTMPGFYVRGDSESDVSRVEEEQPSRVKKDRIGDFGEHIGGSRKDLASKLAEFGDFSGMNETERSELIAKDQLWPSPVWSEKAREADVDPVAVAMVKMLRDGISPYPTRGRWSWKLGDGRRIRVAERATDDATLSSYVGLLRHLRDRTLSIRSMDDYRTFCSELIETTTSTRGNYTTTNFEFVGHGTALKQAWSAMKRRRGGADCLQWVLLTADHALQEAQRQVGRGLFEKKAVQRVKVDSPVIEMRPHLAHLDRKGPDYRQGDVSVETFASTFGFRGGEWGNWQSQEDRRQVLNLAFDSLMDLSRILKVPASALSLNGDLAIAFGARGHGGRALAHYERARRVINLTKLSGAGSLAHEWAHAWDHHIGMRVGQGYASAQPTEGARAGQLATVMRSIAKKTQEKEDTLRACGIRAANEVERVRSFMDFAIRQMKEPDSSVVAEMREAASYVASADLAGKKEALKAFRDHFERHVVVDGRLPGFDKRVLHDVRYAISGASLERLARMATEEGYFPVQVVTDYISEAGKLDERRSKRYFTEPWELFARAFESYAFDRLHGSTGPSDYLVHGVEEGRYSGPSYAGNPYPQGKERREIGDAIEKAMAVWAQSLRHVQGKAHEYEVESMA